MRALHFVVVLESPVAFRHKFRDLIRKAGTRVDSKRQSVQVGDQGFLAFDMVKVVLRDVQHTAL